MFTTLISMALFALVGSITPGPVNIIATSAGANFGLMRALPHVFGATLAYTLIVFLVGVGLNEILERHPEFMSLLRYMGGGFLLVMSYKIATAQPFSGKSAIGAKPPSFLEGALTQWLNPKAWLVSMSGVSLFVAPHSPAFFYLLIFCGISLITCLIGIGTWAVIGHLVRDYLFVGRRQQIFNAVMGLLLSGAVIAMLVNG